MNNVKSIYLLLVCLVFSLTAGADDFSLERLMSLLASQPTLKARFTEEKFDSFLEIPLSMSGQVSFISPDYLEKTISKPSPQSFILDGDTITVSLKQQEARTYSLEQHPQIRAFTESFRSTLSGDLKTLQTYYDVSLSGQSEQWVMSLKPINKRISQAIEKMEFNGVGQRLTRVTTWQNNGDYSVMTFIPSISADINNE